MVSIVGAIHESPLRISALQRFTLLDTFQESLPFGSQGLLSCFSEAEVLI
jgi:hypothetical protein